MNEQSVPFRSVILELVCNKLNMMLSETFQLQEEVDYNDYEQLTEVVLKAIARGQIQSVHLTAAEAEKTLKILSGMDCIDDYSSVSEYGGNGSDGADEGYPPENYTSDNNPFVNGPF